jgi:hypothetical protein
MASSISSSSPSPLPPVAGGGAQTSAVSNSDPAEETRASASTGSRTEETSQTSPAAPSGSGRGQNVDILV